MSQLEAVLRGTIEPDGTLTLDEMPHLSPGRVTVVLRSESPATEMRTLGPEYFKMMDDIWARQSSRSHVPRSVGETQAERVGLANEMEDEIAATIRIQEECRINRQPKSESTRPLP